MDNDDTDKLIREDREEHPNCNYSISNSKTCKTKDGALVCEMMKSINRNCPNKRPVNIYSSTSKFDDYGDGLNNTSIFPGFQDPFGLFKEMERSIATSPRSGGPAIRPNKDPVRDVENGRQDSNSWIEFRFGNDPFSDGSKADEGILGSIFKQFGISVSSGSDAHLPAADNSKPKLNESGPKVPPGTKVGPPEDI
eukprot:GDKK01072038.1.p1 GENE.GDKK01072038.1~~GDKK01072038.1.p1  ORF type:complete len:207 (-),score=12.65 GDKK01072038.1:109-693(-)